MIKKNLKRFSMLSAFAFIIGASSCKKEDITILPPADDTTAPTMMFIRAVEKDSSITNSQQIPIR